LKNIVQAIFVKINEKASCVENDIHVCLSGLNKFLSDFVNDRKKIFIHAVLSVED